MLFQVAFLQIVGSANVAFRINWPTVFEDAINAMKVAMLDVITITRAGCAAPMTFYDTYAADAGPLVRAVSAHSGNCCAPDRFGATMGIFVGLSIVGVAGMVWLDSRRRKAERLALRTRLAPKTRRSTRSPSSRRVARPSLKAGARSSHRLARPSVMPAATPARRRSTLAVLADNAGLSDVNESLKRLRWPRVFSAMSMFWLLCYPGVSVKLIHVFRCVEVQGKWWLEADMRLECFGAQWSATAVFSVILLVLYTVGLPLGISLWLRSRRSTLSKEETIAELGFLYEL